MNYTFLPSLEHIVLVKIATTFWNRSDLRYSLIKEDSIRLEYDLFNIGKNIEETIKEKVLLLNIPCSLKGKILCVIKPIGFEIVRWMICNKKSYNLALNLPHEFSWTPHGTIDRKKTAEALMTDETIDITERYKLACIYCLDNYVGALWEKMPENYRASFYSEDDPKKVPQHELVVIWTYGIKGEMAKLENIIRWISYKEQYRWMSYENHYICHTSRMMTETCTPEQYPVKCAFIHSNKVAAEYFWSKLSLEDREDSLRFMLNNWLTKSLSYIAGDSDCFYILRFLLIRVNKDQQKALFRKYQIEVLSCFLMWPWQSLFMDMTKYVLLTFSKNYFYLLVTIVDKVELGFKDYDYQRLFGEFWQKSNECNKKFVIDMLCERNVHYDGGHLLGGLFRNKDMKNISLILKAVSALEKEAIFNSRGSRIFVDLYCRKEFDMLEFFIDKFISSHEQMIKFKDTCLEDFWEHHWHHHDRPEKFLNDLIEKFNLKRNTEESHCSSAKRLCSSSDM